MLRPFFMRIGFLKIGPVKSDKLIDGRMTRGPAERRNLNGRLYLL
jgi:hypothetical protein